MQDGKMRHRKIHNYGCYVRRVKYYANSCLPLVADFNFRDFQHGILMVALWNRADHYIFILWFLSSIFLFFSSPNLSGCTLDVYHTSTHGVALVRI